MARSTASRTPPAASRLGSETPRVYTPPLRELTPETSLGYSVIEFATDVLRIELYPWQRWLLVHALELNVDGSFRFRTVVLLVARQNGKSTLSQVLSLWFMYVLGYSMVLGTAQDLDTAEEVWQGAVDLVQEEIDDVPVRPELAELVKRVNLTNGKKSLDLTSGQRYKVKAASRRAGRGLSGDLILLDELREHQSWDAWGAITKTTMARPDAQVWALSNAGDAASIVLRYLRKMGHDAIGDPDGINDEDDLFDDDEPDEIDLPDEDDSLGIFEWSAPPGCAISDRDGWAQANPSLGYGITERTIASAARTDPAPVFRTEVLCQWLEGAADGPFPAGTWSATTDPSSTIADPGSAPFCLDVSWDRSTSYIAVAGARADNSLHGEVVASRPGTDWVVEWLIDKPQRKGRPVVVQTKGAPASSLIPDLRAAGIEVIEWGGADLGGSCGQLYDAVLAQRFHHRSQPVLDRAAATAVTKPLGDSWVWDRRKSPVDAAPLIAVTGACWYAARPQPSTSSRKMTVWRAR